LMLKVISTLFAYSRYVKVISKYSKLNDISKNEQMECHVIMEKPLELIPEV